MPVAAVGAYFGELQPAGRSTATQRSYGMALLRWFRFLWAVEITWRDATRVEARDFCRWIRLIEIRDNLTARTAEAEREGWLGEAEGLRVSLAAAKEKLAQTDNTVQRRAAAVALGMPAFPRVAARTVTAPRSRADRGDEQQHSSPPVPRSRMVGSVDHADRGAGDDPVEF